MTMAHQDTDKLPLILEPEQLEEIDPDTVRVIDLSKAETHARMHIPGAVPLDYAAIVAQRKPVAGLIPDDAHLNAVFGRLGIGPDTRVVAYDDEGGGKAARLIWTLQVAGHERVSLLNGGLHAWANEGHALSSDRREVDPVSGDYHTAGSERVADRAYIRGRLDDPNYRLLDTRSIEEYRGIKRFANRGGHIPGAIHWEWTDAMDRQRNLRLKSTDTLLADLKQRGITPGDEVTAYCQTHHRSAYVCVVLEALGFAQVRGYPGSWSDWGNQPDTPVE